MDQKAIPAFPVPLNQGQCWQGMAPCDHMPHIEPNTPPDEAERVRADIEYQKHRERWREDRALALQWRYGDGQ